MESRRTIGVLATALGTALGIAAGAATALAQPVVQGTTAPQPLPVRPGLPGTAREELGIDRPPPLLREGAFVSAARGVLAKGQSGRWYIVFDQDTRGRKMPPMVVLPSQNLAALERIAGRIPTDKLASSQVRILVTGQVLAYQGHNYLLPTAPPILETTGHVPAAASGMDAGKVRAGAEEEAAGEAVTGEGEVREQGATEGEVAGGDKADAGDGDDKPDANAEPTIEQIVGDLDRALGAKRATNPSIMSDPEPTVGESGGRVRPAGFMTARRGRVVRAGGGEPTFVVDSGTAGEVPEPPLALLPCTNLSAIETLAERLGEAATFTISGRITVYRGRNFLLPTTYIVNRVTDQVIPNQ